MKKDTFYVIVGHKNDKPVSCLDYGESDFVNYFGIYKTKREAEQVLPGFWRSYRYEYPEIRVEKAAGNFEEILDLACNDSLNYRQAIGTALMIQHARTQK